MNEPTLTITLSATDLNAVIACLHDVDDIRRNGGADELLRDNTADYDRVGELADRLEAVLKPSWNPDEI